MRVRGELNRARSFSVVCLCHLIQFRMEIFLKKTKQNRMIYCDNNQRKNYLIKKLKLAESLKIRNLETDIEERI